MKRVLTVQRLTLVLALMFMLSGCGFKLRSTDTNFTESGKLGYTVQVKSSEPGLRFRLAASLRAQGYGVVPSDADIVIQIFKESINDDELELHSDYGLLPKTLNYELQYAIFLGDSTSEYAPETLEVSMTYTEIGSSEVARTTVNLAAKERIRQEAANQLVERLALVISKEMITSPSE